MPEIAAAASGAAVRGTCARLPPPGMSWSTCWNMASSHRLVSSRASAHRSRASQLHGSTDMEMDMEIGLFRRHTQSGASIVHWHASPSMRQSYTPSSPQVPLRLPDDTHFLRTVPVPPATVRASTVQLPPALVQLLAPFASQLSLKSLQ